MELRLWSTRTWSVRTSLSIATTSPAYVARCAAVTGVVEPRQGAPERGERIAAAVSGGAEFRSAFLCGCQPRSDRPRNTIPHDPPHPRRPPARHLPPRHV